MTKGNRQGKGQGKVVSMVDHQLAKGDVQGAITMMLNGCDSVSAFAQDAIAELEANRDRLNAKAQSVLSKYTLL